jgi:hypothetical protein
MARASIGARWSMMLAQEKSQKEFIYENIPTHMSRNIGQILRKFHFNSLISTHIDKLNRFILAISIQFAYILHHTQRPPRRPSSRQ